MIIEYFYSNVNDERKKNGFYFRNGLGFILTKWYNLSQRFFFVWICSESPFLEVCKLTDLMAVKVGRFTDLGAVLVEYYWASSNKGFNMQGLTHVFGKSKLFIRTYKVGAFTDLVAVFESHCCLCTCREHAEKWPRNFCWSHAIYRTDLLGFFDNPS